MEIIEFQAQLVEFLIIYQSHEKATTVNYLIHNHRQNIVHLEGNLSCR